MWVCVGGGGGGGRGVPNNLSMISLLKEQMYLGIDVPAA